MLEHAARPHPAEEEQGLPPLSVVFTSTDCGAKAHHVTLAAVLVLAASGSHAISYVTCPQTQTVEGRSSVTSTQNSPLPQNVPCTSAEGCPGLRATVLPSHMHLTVAGASSLPTKDGTVWEEKVETCTYSCIVGDDITLKAS